ncbi:hypothetical protein M422DRAFT_254699 [Sphaerobolus stellatus SS14]|uniref:Uncharacterized protein n=1 Tax=Sphaerobolus stellatus (strain SS14) TaxID=990650 RepID=A0A0C9UGU9_SPHS4|nr:hypothetical protein M422DRAFT_254699 [Sphaerobolus stellatus SS14]
MGVDERPEAYHLPSITSVRVLCSTGIGQCNAPSPHCLRSRRRWHQRKERLLLQAYNVSATSRDVTVSDIESHAPDVGSRDNLTATPRSFLGCCMALASSTFVDASTSRYSNNATCPHDGFTTAASLHKFSNSIIPPRLQLLRKGLYHSRSDRAFKTVSSIGAPRQFYPYSHAPCGTIAVDSCVEIPDQMVGQYYQIGAD